MASVFISYAGADFALALRLESALRQVGIECWLDRTRIHPGVSVPDEIESALRQANWAILLVSPAFFENDWTRAELRAIKVRSVTTNLQVFSVLIGVASSDFQERAPFLQPMNFVSAEMGIDLIVGGLLDAVRGTPNRPHPLEVRHHREDGLEYVYVAGATFLMGSSREQDPMTERDEEPPHAVTVRAFWISVTPITCAAFYRFQLTRKGLATAAPMEDDLPCVNVNWPDAAEYARWAGGDLPTEAQWEYAARGGLVGSRYPCGNSISAVDANFRSTTGELHTLARLKSYRPNRFGLYQMSGNVEEWTRDNYGPYSSSHQNNPRGVAEGICKVVRGGSYNSASSGLRVSSRSHLSPDARRPDLGFRVVLPQDCNMLTTR